MREKACVFVDGENLRRSLVDVFSDDGIFKPRDYLPATAEWAKFFDWVVLIATAGTHHRLRTYWFVVQELDFFPYGLSQPNRGTNEELKRVLLRHRPFRERLRALSGTELLREMEEMLGQLREGQRGIDSQFRRWNRSERNRHSASSRRISQSRCHLIQPLREAIRQGKIGRCQIGLRYADAA